MLTRLWRSGFAGLTLVLFLLGAESSARLDDWLHQNTPIWANPNRARELTVHDRDGIHGRPDGRFKKWQLNAHGFRSPAMMDRTPSPGVTRIMILGASETFGLYESAGKEYPVQLAEHLRREGVEACEVINAAMAGMTVHSQLPYWERWACRFQPQIVLVYPSPHFYLDDEPPHRWPQADPPAEQEAAPASRFAARLRERVRTNALVRQVRLEWLLWSRASGQGEDWIYQNVPQDRLQFFLDDLEALLGAVVKQGARPVLLTHAIKAGSPVRAEDRQDLRAFRLFASRATEEGIVAFEDAANAGIRRLASDKDIVVIDVAAQLSGRHEYFGDLVHFNDAGAAAMARLLAAALADPRHDLVPQRTRPDGAP